MKIAALTVGVIGTNCYLVSDEAGNTAIIDPGAQPEKISAYLEKEHLIPRMILLTHGHFDHIGGVSFLQQRYGIPVCVPADDAEMLDDNQKNGSGAFGFPVTAVSGARLLKDGEEVQAGKLKFVILHTPGHTRGSSCYRIEDALFTGDTLFCGGVGRTDLYGGNLSDLKASVRLLAELPGDFQVYPGHGESTTLAAERAANPYMGRNGYDTLF